MEQLGIQPELLLAQVVNFTIIIVILTKLLYKPILAILEKRKKEIEEALSLTEKLRQEEERTAVKREKILTTARAEAAAIVEEAKKQAKDAQQDILTSAHSQAHEIIAKGKEEAERLKADVLVDARKSAVTLAVVMAKRLLDSVVSQKDQHTVISRHLKELESFAKKQT